MKPLRLIRALPFSLSLLVVAWLLPAAAAPATGHWGIADNLPGAALQGMAAGSSTDVWAVGSLGDAPLTEHWDGSGWLAVACLDPGSGADALNAVSEVSSTDVWAVGGTWSGFASNSLIEHWDGTSWSVDTSAPPGTGYDSLEGVAAVSATDVWAVGHTGFGNDSNSLIEHWDGTAWSIVSSPSPGEVVFLHGVSARTADDVWAVGNYTIPSTGAIRALVLHWNGSAWTRVAAQNPNSQAFLLNAVSALSASDAWAVGRISESGALIEHWDGSGWTVVPGPGPLDQLSALTALAVVSPDDIWAVGRDWSGSYRTLVLHWDGATWTRVRSPDVGHGYGAPGDYFFGVVAPGSTDAWATGTWGNGQSSGAYLARYDTQPFSSQLTLSATPGSVTFGNPTTLSGTLTFPDGNDPSGQPVHLVRTNPDGSTTTLPDATTDAVGNLQAVDSPAVAGRNTYAATFDGDSLRTGSSGAVDVTATRITALTLTASAGTVNYKGAVKVTAHLSFHGTNDVVSIYRTWAGGPKTLLASGPVDAFGNLSASLSPSKTNTFEAEYTGDDADEPAISSNLVVGVRAAFTSSMVGGYGTSHGYRLYHYTSNCPRHHRGCPAYTATLSPTDHGGDCVYFRIQFHNRTGWHASAVTRCVRLNPSSKATLTLIYSNTSVKNIPFRIRAEFRGDTENAAAVSGWGYFKVTS